MQRNQWKFTDILSTGVLLALGAGLLSSPPSAAQSAFSADGVVESKSGGFKFPDGTVQSEAAVPLGDCPTLDPSDEMIWVGGVCIDKYEASIWDAAEGGNQIIGGIATDYCNPNGQDCEDIYARSVAGVEPARHITWFQAQAALANSGKRLPTNAEWQMAVLGTPDPGEAIGPEDCNILSVGPEATGELANCVSRWGHHDMVGNLAEWVADWDEQEANCDSWPPGFGDDFSCMGRMEGDESNHVAGALLRGGRFSSGGSAGPFKVAAIQPTHSSLSIGFRGAR